ncbi:hypothetical protein ICN48_10925, partial [Polynucleobacter sp. JS-Safj-400b-B2]|uniref:hypothetical protein n=1 Tax=Polynucleobacter sp. JS-Safj-400b-B2 TaxID=2576921 RepID=UPI001C0C4A64
MAKNEELILVPDVDLSNAEVGSRLEEGVTFTADHAVVVDAHTTHLSTSLKDLEKLHISNMGVGGVAGDGTFVGQGGLPTVDLGAGISLHDAATSTDLPQFAADHFTLGADINALLGDTSLHTDA